MEFLFVPIVGGSVRSLHMSLFTHRSMSGSAAAETNLISPSTGGMTLRYGIFIRTDCWGQRPIIAHELVHTSQYERLGGSRDQPHFTFHWRHDASLWNFYSYRLLGAASDHCT